MSIHQFHPRRITRVYRQTIHAAPDIIFPLLCPERETEWLDGWQYSMIFSETGLVEDGAVFSTTQEGEEDTVWIVTNHDPENLTVTFARFTHNSRTCVLKISILPKDEKNSCVDIVYTYTGLSASGNDFIDNFTEEAFLEAVTFWEKSMNHYLATGEKLKKG